MFVFFTEKKKVLKVVPRRFECAKGRGVNESEDLGKGGLASSPNAPCPLPGSERDNARFVRPECVNTKLSPAGTVPRYLPFTPRPPRAAGALCWAVSVCVKFIRLSTVCPSHNGRSILPPLKVRDG